MEEEAIQGVTPSKGTDNGAGNRPDFFIREIETGGRDSLADINAYDANAHDSEVLDRETYKKNPEFVKWAAERGVADLDKAYDAVKLKLHDLTTLNFDSTALSHAPVFDSKIGRAAGFRSVDINKVGRTAKMHETNIGEILTVKQIAMANGVHDQEGDFSHQLDNSFFKTLFSSGGFAVKSEVDSETGMPMLSTDDNGYFMLEAYDGNKQQELAVDRVNIWNTGWAEGTFLDGNKLDESLLNTALRKVPQIAAGAALATGLITGAPAVLGVLALGSLPFFMDMSDGGLELIKSLGIGFTGTDKEKNWINSVQNTMRKFNFDRTYDEMTSPLGMKSIVSNTADVFGQLGGMGSVAQMGARGFNLLTKSMQMASKPVFAQKLGNVMGQAGMAASATKDFPQLARENGIEDDQTIFYMHAGYMGGMMLVGKLSNRLFNPWEKKVLADSYGSAMKSEFANFPKGLEKVLTPGSAATDSFISGMVATGKRTFDKAIKLQRNMTAAGAGKFTKDSVIEGGEEVTELVWEEVLKGAYNITHADKKAGKGRFQDFEMGEFAREATASFIYGAAAGGLFGTALGKRALGQDSDSKSFFDYAIHSDDRRQFDTVLEKELKRFSDTLSYTKDKDGHYMSVDKNSIDPTRRYSQKEMQREVIVNKYEYAKSVINHKMAVAADGADWRTELDKQFRGTVAQNWLDVNSDITGMMDKQIKLDKEKDDIAAQVTSGAITEDIGKEKLKLLDVEVKKIDDELKEIMSGARRSHYIQKAVYNHTPTNMLYTAFTELGVEMEEIEKISIESFNKKKDESEVRSQAILDSVDPEEMKRISLEGPLFPEAVARMKQISEDPEIKRRQREVIVDALNAHFSNHYNNPIYSDPVAALQQEMDFILPQLEEAVSVDEMRMVVDQEGDPIYYHIGDLTKDLMRTDIDYKSDMLRVKKLEKYDPMSIFSILPETHLDVEESVAQAVKDPGDHLGPILERVKKRLDHVKALAKVSGASHLVGHVQDSKQYIPPLHENDLESRIMMWHAAGTPKNMGSELLKELDNIYANEYKDTITKLEDQLNKIDKVLREWEDSKKDPVAASKDQQMIPLNKDISRMQTSILPHLKSLIHVPEIVKEASNANALLIKAADAKTFDDKLVFYMQAHQLVHVMFNSLSDADMNTVAEGLQGETVGNLTLHNQINVLDKVDLKEFHIALLDVINQGQSAPTWEQQRAIRELYAHSKGVLTGKVGIAELILRKRLLKSIPDANPFDKYKNNPFRFMQYIRGTGGSGKTTFVTGNGVKMVSDLIKKMGFAETKVLAMGFTADQQTKVREQIKGKNLELVFDSDSHVTVENLVNLLNTKDKALDEMGVVVFDEATFIAATNIPGSLDALNTAVEAYNATHRANGRAPVQVKFLGDQNQGGFFAAIDKEVSEHNINMMNYIDKSTYLEVSQRSGFQSLQAMKDGFESYVKNSGTNFGKPFKVTTNSGMDGGKPAGGEFTKTPEEKDRAIMEILTAGGSFFYVTDRNLSTDAEYARLLAKFPTLKDHTFHYTNVQGKEADYVVVDYVSTEKNSNYSMEFMKVREMNVAVGRAMRKAVVVHNSKDRVWESARDKAQDKMENNIPDTLYDKVKISTVGTITNIIKELPDAVYQKPGAYAGVNMPPAPAANPAPPVVPNPPVVVPPVTPPPPSGPVPPVVPPSGPVPPTGPTSPVIPIPPFPKVGVYKYGSTAKDRKEYLQTLLTDTQGYLKSLEGMDVKEVGGIAAYVQNKKKAIRRIASIEKELSTERTGPIKNMSREVRSITVNGTKHGALNIAGKNVVFIQVEGRIFPVVFDKKWVFSSGFKGTEFVPFTDLEYFFSKIQIVEDILKSLETKYPDGIEGTPIHVDSIEDIFAVIGQPELNHATGDEWDRIDKGMDITGRFTLSPPKKTPGGSDGELTMPPGTLLNASSGTFEANGFTAHNNNSVYGQDVVFSDGDTFIIADGSEAHKDSALFAQTLVARLATEENLSPERIKKIAEEVAGPFADAATTVTFMRRTGENSFFYYVIGKSPIFVYKADGSLKSSVHGSIKQNVEPVFVSAVEGQQKGIPEAPMQKSTGNITLEPGETIIMGSGGFARNLVASMGRSTSTDADYVASMESARQDVLKSVKSLPKGSTLEQLAKASGKSLSDTANYLGHYIKDKSFLDVLMEKQPKLLSELIGLADPSDFSYIAIGKTGQETILEPEPIADSALSDLLDANGIYDAHLRNTNAKGSINHYNRFVNDLHKKFQFALDLSKIATTDQYASVLGNVKYYTVGLDTESNPYFHEQLTEYILYGVPMDNSLRYEEFVKPDNEHGMQVADMITNLVRLAEAGQDFSIDSILDHVKNLYLVPKGTGNFIKTQFLVHTHVANEIKKAMSKVVVRAAPDVTQIINATVKGSLAPDIHPLLLRNIITADQKELNRITFIAEGTGLFVQNPDRSRTQIGTFTGFEEITKNGPVDVSQSVRDYFGLNASHTISKPVFTEGKYVSTGQELRDNMISKNVHIHRQAIAFKIDWKYNGGIIKKGTVIYLASYDIDALNNIANAIKFDQVIDPKIFTKVALIPMMHKGLSFADWVTHLRAIKDHESLKDIQTYIKGWNTESQKTLPPKEYLASKVGNLINSNSTSKRVLERSPEATAELSKLYKWLTEVDANEVHGDNFKALLSILQTIETKYPGAWMELKEMNLMHGILTSAIEENNPHRDGATLTAIRNKNVYTLSETDTRDQLLKTMQTELAPITLTFDIRFTNAVKAAVSNPAPPVKNPAETFETSLATLKTDALNELKDQTLVDALFELLANPSAKPIAIGKAKKAFGPDHKVYLDTLSGKVDELRKEEKNCPISK
jgi:hypothetical protein